MTTLEQALFDINERFVIANGVRLEADGVIAASSEERDFSSYGAAVVRVAARPLDRFRGDIVVTVETSADGNSWTEAGSVSCGVDGIQYVTVDSPEARLRAKASGLRGSWLFHVEAVGIAGSSGGGSLPVETVDLTTEEWGALFSEPVELVAAPGAGKAIVVVSAAAKQSNTVPFATETDLRIGFEPGNRGFFESDVAQLTTPGDYLFPFSPTADVEIFDNLPLLLYADDEDPALIGGILTSSIDEGGADYEAGDTITLNAGEFVSGDPAAIEVDTVDGDGVVLTYHVTDPGASYAAGGDTVQQDSSDGAGTGFALNVLTITPSTDVEGRVQIIYSVMDLP